MNCRSCVSRLFLCALALGETLFLDGCSADRNGSPWDSLPQANSKKTGTPDDDDDNDDPAAPNPNNGPKGPEDGADAPSSAPSNSGNGGVPMPPGGGASPGGPDGGANGGTDGGTDGGADAGPPADSFKVTSSCTGNRFTLRITPLAGGGSSQTMNGFPNCARLSAAIQGQTFPKTPATAAALQGGPTVQTSCNKASFSFRMQSGGTQIDLRYALPSAPGCNDFRNTINALKL